MTEVPLTALQVSVLRQKHAEQARLEQQLHRVQEETDLVLQLILDANGVQLTSVGSTSQEIGLDLDRQVLLVP